MPLYRFKTDYTTSTRDYAAGDVAELGETDPLVVGGVVEPVEQEIDDLPDDAPVDEVDEPAAHVIHRKPSSRKAKG